MVLEEKPLPGCASLPQQRQGIAWDPEPNP